MSDATVFEIMEGVKSISVKDVGSLTLCRIRELIDTEKNRLEPYQLPQGMKL